MNQYYCQCPNGHVDVIEPGTELHQRAIDRQQQGYLDAIGISCDNCPQCIEERFANAPYFQMSP